MRQTLEEELEQPRLHPEQYHVLKRMKEQWDGLTVFVDHPYIPMDNNGSECILRNPVIGRKTYFAYQDDTRDYR